MKKLIAALCFSLFALTSAWSQTNIPAGPVSGIWNLAGSPYLIQGEIQIESGASLQIDAGVDVIFQGHYKFIINGTLTANGTAEDSVRFTAEDPQIGWHGLRFISSPPGNLLTYCIIENGIASGVQQNNSGGGVYCYISTPVFQHCSIRNNSAGYGGGGVYMHENSAPQLIDCDIVGNSSGDSGGGVTVTVNSAPLLDGCLIADNSTFRCGGGVAIGWDSDPTFTGCTITGNTSSYFGGGIDCDYSTPHITGCFISENHANVLGGGLDADFSDPVIDYTTFYANSTGVNSGGFDFWNCNPVMNRCVLSGNQAQTYGSAGTAWYTNLTLTNSIIDHNGGLGAIYLNNNTASSFTYNDFYGNSGSNVLGSIMPAGLGVLSTVNANGDSCDTYSNIFIEPQYVDFDHQDFRVFWTSPCVDAGNPDNQYNDPDATVADIGCFYFDQSNPVNVMILPVNPPIIIPSGGGTLTYTVWMTNITGTSQTLSGWFDLTLPNGTVTSPILGPLQLTLPSNVAISRTRPQSISGTYPDGELLFNARAVVGSDTSADSFPFIKGGATIAGSWIDPDDSNINNILEPDKFFLNQNYPNPFNPVTTIVYQIPAAAHVNLKVYDITGRQVTELVDAYLEAGPHEAIFDATGFSSGTYFYRLTSGSFSMSRQMVLVK